MITIRGKQFSEDTIAKALEKHCNFEKPYIFKSGDIVTYNGHPCILLSTDFGLTGFCPDGAITVTGQCAFVEQGYKKVSSLDNYDERN